MLNFNNKDIAILKKARTIKPVVRSLFGKMHYIEAVDVCSKGVIKHAKQLCRTPKLKVIDKVMTIHAPKGYKGEFAYSVYEVLEQIPEHLLEQAVAFSVKGKVNFSHPFDENFLAETTLYGLADGEKTPSVIQRQPIVMNGYVFSSKTIENLEL